MSKLTRTKGGVGHTATRKAKADPQGNRAERRAAKKAKKAGGRDA